MRLERHADHVARDALGLVGVLRQLDAAALAAATRVNLRLDDHGAAAQTLGDLASLGSRERHLAARHGNAVAREDGFGLIFVDFHWNRSGRGIRSTATGDGIDRCAERSSGVTADGAAHPRRRQDG